MVTRVFLAVKNGTFTPIDGPAVAVLVRLEELRRELKQGFDDVRDSFAPFLDFIKHQRQDPSAETRRIQETVLGLRYGGLCPCCEEVLLLQDGEITVELNWEHYNGNRQDASFENIWPICRECHRKKSTRADKLDAKDRVHFDAHFRVFQDRCKQFRCRGEQIALFGD